MVNQNWRGIDEPQESAQAAVVAEYAAIDVYNRITVCYCAGPYLILFCALNQDRYAGLIISGGLDEWTSQDRAIVLRASYLDNEDIQSLCYCCDHRHPHTSFMYDI
jgi:hypothetical protein